MDRVVTLAKLQRFMDDVGASATTPGTIFFTGGATALLLGIREQTIYIDIKLDPEPGGVFEAIAQIKIALDVNVELASPDLFIPPLPGWRGRSQYIRRSGSVDFRHYDFYAQALAKIERGYFRDIADVRALLEHTRIESTELARLAEEICPEFIRYPAIDVTVFEQKVKAFLMGHAS